MGRKSLTGNEGKFIPLFLDNNIEVKDLKRRLDILHILSYPKLTMPDFYKMIIKDWVKRNQPRDGIL